MKKIPLALSLLSLCALPGLVFMSQLRNANIEIINADDVDDGKCLEALNLLDLNVDTAQIVNAFRLPSMGQYGTTITWKSSNEASLKITTDSASGYVAKVTRGESEATVTLTATATLKGSLTASKDFTLTILKKDDSPVSDLPLAMSEDFSSYSTGIELSNYFKYQSSSSDVECASATEEVSGNINNMPSPKALSIQSVRTASSITYTRKINVTMAEAKEGAVLEGDFLIKGETNGVSIELMRSGSVLSAFRISSSGNDLYESGAYAHSTKKEAEEGVWEHFRLVFKPSSGRTTFLIYDWNKAGYVNVTEEGKSYIDGAGVSSGVTGNVDALRLNIGRGSKYGTTYLANLKLDIKANLPESAPTNHNRETGIGEIEGYEKTVFATTDETAEGLSPSFIVHNRFNEEKVLTKGTDYAVSGPVIDGDEEAKTYSYTITLATTGEGRTITQYVYYSAAGSVVSVSSFKGSYLKPRKIIDGGTTTTYGYITLSGSVMRNDGTLHYLIMRHGSDAPTSAVIISNDKTLEGYVLGGEASIITHEFSIDSGNLPYDGAEYDVYAVATNKYGSSDIYLSTGISTTINVSSCEEFHEMSSSLDTLASTFRLTKDLDFSSYYWDFDPTSRSFTGILDGEGHTISNLTIANPTTTGGVKTGIFFNLNGTVKNITFRNATVSGYTDVGILGGNSYGCNVTNVNFIDCTVKQDEAVSGGDGYFATAVGRVRGGENLFSNIAITNSTIKSPQRSGLLVAGAVGTSESCSLSVDHIVASGSISETGAHAGLIGRNQSSAINVSDAIVSLEVRTAKKEVGSILGRNEVGGTIKTTRAIGDLTIKEMTQPTYFGQYIGYDAALTGGKGKNFDYEANDVYFFDNDYSDLGDSITPIKNAVTPGKMVSIPEEYTKKFWETKTFLRDLDTSSYFSYDGEKGWPTLNVREASDIFFTSSDFGEFYKAIDFDDIVSSHYALYKADDCLALLSAEEKAKIASSDLEKLAKGKSDYALIATELSSIGEGI